MARESPVTLGFGLDGQVAQDLMLVIPKSMLLTICLFP